IITPSTWNASPTDRWRQPGPYEEAVLNTPLLEETNDPAQFKGIDILRAIRSFDPCMPCTTHIHSDAGVITREVNTCACGVDEDGGVNSGHRPRRRGSRDSPPALQQQRW